MSFVSNHIYYILQSGRAPLHEIMLAFASSHNAIPEHHCRIVMDRLVQAGADVNVVDKVSYHLAPYYNN